MEVLLLSDIGFVKGDETEKEPSKSKEIGVGMLGYGFMGKAHTNAYKNMPIFFYPPPANPKLVAIYGRKQAKVEAAANHYGYETWYTDWMNLVNNEKVELVDISLPNNMHYETALTAAEMGKNVLCEKPLAANSTQAEEMFNAVKKAHVKNMVGFNYRFVPALRLTKKLIAQNYIGDILQYKAVYLQEWIMDPNFPLVWSLDRKIAGTGALGDLGSHIIDLARFLVGEVSSVCALTKTFVDERPLEDNPMKKGKVTVDDSFISILTFKNGAIGSIEASRFCAGRKNYQQIEVYGTEGSILFNLERLNELQYYSRKDPEETQGFKNILVTEPVHPFIKNWWPQGHIIGWEHTFIHEIYHLFDAIINDKKVEPYGATFHDGLICNQIMDAILHSVDEGKWINV